MNDKHCPTCYGLSESKFANGYVCPTCGRRESLFLSDIGKCVTPSASEPFLIARLPDRLQSKP